MTEETLFELVLNTPPDERNAVLERKCDGKPELRARVEQLLAAHFAKETRKFPTVAPTASFASVDPVVGTMVGGKYRLTQLIGEGGMGSVWAAEQTDPVKRKVAVKLIKPGMDSKQVLARFEAERQALALMDHPNIAKVFDGGLHDSRPFFVMELVKGVPITEFCDSRRLTPRQRLELFVPVCLAIQHAHQKGIIHRDVKPSNVLIAMYDDRPVPKVIDFGVAKATGGELTEATIDTGFGGVVGTPQYMSPEQATFNNLDVDTRTDVYSLGILLYELLAGSPPFSGKELKKRGLLEILRVVREEEPPRPSTKLSTDDALPSVSANRSVEPRTLTGLLRNELDWIVMKAIEKDRVRRYETANGFAADVNRFLAGEPVLAHPPSGLYRLRKLVRRNRVPFVAGGLLLLSLAAGIVGTSIGMIRAEQRRIEAEKNLAYARKSSDILGAVFANIDPTTVAKTGRPLQQLLKENLLVAARELEAADIGDPVTVARLQNTLGLSLYAISATGEALPLFEKALVVFRARFGSEDPVTLNQRHNIALCLAERGDHKGSIAILEDVLRLRRVALGVEDRATQSSMINLAIDYSEDGRLVDALKLREELVRLCEQKHGRNHPSTLFKMNELAVSYSELDRHQEALALRREIYDVGAGILKPDDPDLLLFMGNLAVSLSRTGRPSEALELNRKALERRKSVLGLNHHHTIWNMHDVANDLADLGRQAEALPIYEEVLRLRKEKFGPMHPQTVLAMSSVGMCLSELGRFQDAEPHIASAFAAQKSHYGSNHPDTQRTAAYLANSRVRTGRHVEAVQVLEAELAAVKAAGGNTTSITRNILYTLACIQSLAIAKAPDKNKQADVAMDALAKAVEAGYSNVAHMKKDTDLDPLRSRDDFKKLIADLEKAASNSAPATK